MGANDGIVSTASLIVGVAAANGSPRAVLVAGAAGVVAGAMSMAAGEYVSVSSQADTEAADLRRERLELQQDPEAEVAELTAIYEQRGVSAELARKVALELMSHDAIGAPAHDELGISEMTTAKPVQAALASAGTFTAGALLPLLTVAVVPPGISVLAVALASLVCLAGLGALAAQAGGAPVARSMSRVTFWGAAAMGLTTGVGSLFGALE